MSAQNISYFLLNTSIWQTEIEYRGNLFVSYKSKKNRVIAHFLISNLPNQAQNTHLRQNKKMKSVANVCFIYTCDRF